jgi:hypothetical protein
MAKIIRFRIAEELQEANTESKKKDDLVLNDPVNEYVYDMDVPV